MISSRTASSTVKSPVKPLNGGRLDYWLLALVAVILTIGSVTIYSASFVVSAAQLDGNSTYILFRHLMWLAVGLVGMVIAARLDYHLWRRYSVAAMLVVMILLAMVVLLPEQFAPSRYGAKRWLTPLGKDNQWQLQPSEIAKLVLIVYAAYWLTSKGDKVRRFTYGLVPFAITLGFIIGLVMLEPDMGTSIVIGVIGIAMFFVAGANLLHLLLFLSLAGGAGLGLAFAASYRVERLMNYVDPLSDITTHTAQALMGLGSGGIFGVGLGASRSKFFWLPTVHTDSIFVVLGEEMGLIGTTLVVFLFLALAWRGYSIAWHAPDSYGRLVAVGITTYIVFQAFLNIAVVSNLVPFTGIPLPFISYGGSSLAISMTAIGLLLNISRQQVDRPQILEIEAQRELERRHRDFLREQRAAERERREAQRKLKELEQAEQEQSELDAARKAWETRTTNEKAEILWREQVQKQLEAQKEAERLRREQEKAEEEVQQQLLPSLATRSFLNFRKGGDEYKPSTGGYNLRRPRRDWAKVYHHLARRNENNKD